MSGSLPLILLSGMGADERLFRPQRECFPNLIVPKWIANEPHDTLETYAARFARQLDPGAPCFIGGASFGGFVALEMARHLDAKACFLIGSVRGPQEFPRRIRPLRACAGATQAMPFEWVCALADIGATTLGGLSAPATRSFLRQLSDSDAAFLRWATRAVFTWQPAPPPPNLPIHQIHGDRDRILPAAHTHPDRLVRGAGHVLSLTHADEVNEFLRTHIRRHESPARGDYDGTPWPNTPPNS